MPVFKHVYSNCNCVLVYIWMQVCSVAGNWFSYTPDKKHSCVCACVCARINSKLSKKIYIKIGHMIKRKGNDSFDIKRSF